MIPVEPEGLDYEASVFRRMQEGEADLAAMGTRAWDDFGGPGLAALNAPFLVDSYPLQERIFTSGLVETLLEAAAGCSRGSASSPAPSGTRSVSPARWRPRRTSEG